MYSYCMTLDMLNLTGLAIIAALFVANVDMHLTRYVLWPLLALLYDQD